MRFRVIYSCLLLAFLGIVLRLWFWQVIQSDNLTAKAEEQRISLRTVLAPRGSILFNDGSVLASVQPTFLIFAQPKIIQNKELVADKLAQYFWADELHLAPVSEEEKAKEIENLRADIKDKLSKDLFWVSLQRKVTLETKQKIERENFFGIGFDTQLERFYPEGSSSAHLLGFVGADKYGEPTGYFGVEGFYDGELKGKDGLITQDKDAQGLPILIGTYKVKEAKSGKDLTLTVDRTIQHIVEENLLEGIQKYGAKSASAIVMDPKTGNIIGLASYPNYDPGKPADFPTEFFKDPITVDGYEPGSTFKVLVMAAGINEHLVTPDTQCDICAGPINLGGFTIRTWNNEYNPNSTMSDVIIHSDNTGMVFVAKKLGIDKMYDYVTKFGFGKLTGIDLQDEYAPDLRPKNDWKEIDLATSSFGQGISATALQIVRAVASLANGGVLMEPHMVKSIKDDKGVVVINPREVAHVVTAETAKAVTEMMVKAVEQGEAKFFRLKGYRVAGKTGTAQIPVAGHYDANKTIASFVGFAPADDPKFVMLVRYDQPTASIYGAETAAPTFFNIARQIFTYYNIAPTEQ